MKKWTSKGCKTTSFTKYNPIFTQDLKMVNLFFVTSVSKFHYKFLLIFRWYMFKILNELVDI